MKCTTIIDNDRDEEVIIHVHRDCALAQKIRELCQEAPCELIGYEDTGFVIIDPDKVHCFTLENGKLFALTENKKLLINMKVNIKNHIVLLQTTLEHVHSQSQMVQYSQMKVEVMF